MAIDPSNFKPLSADSLASKSNEDVSQSSKLLPTHRRADLVAPKAATLSTPEKTLDPVTSAATPITVPALNNSEAVGHSADARAGNSKPLSGHDQELMRRQVENEILKQNLQSNSAGSLWPAYTRPFNWSHTRFVPASSASTRSKRSAADAPEAT